MKRIVYYFFTLLSICFLITCIFLRGSYYSFNSLNVKNNIEYLSSNKFNGRLTGTKENERAAQEINSMFKEYGLTPLTSDYLEDFKVNAPVYSGEKSSIRLYNGSTLVNDFTLGEDFKEDGINFKKASIVFSKEDKIDIFPSSFSIEKDGLSYVFYVTYDQDFSFRSSFISNSNVGFAIQITTNTFTEILNSLRDGNTLEVKLPYTIEEKNVYNVAGKINGSDRALPPLVLTAHFDHLGQDSIGNIYPGALDNSSGTCFLLELARTFSSMKTPKRDIIFIALNGEEFGLLGSKEFAEKYKDKLNGAEIINLDMIGAKDYPITFMTGANDNNVSSELLDSLSYICTNQDLPYNITANNSSDHASFINEGLNSLTITQSDLTKIHTPYDKAADISTTSIDKVYSLVDNKITEYAYYDITLLMYSKKALIFFSFTTFFLLIIEIRLKFLKNIFE